MVKIKDIRNQTQRTNGTRNISQIKHIVRHHSATTSGNFNSFWRHWNGTKGWGTGGYHEIILRDGTVELCYNPNEITNGIANDNTTSYHICLVGNSSFTEAQEKAWDERVAYNMNRLGVGVNNVKGHGEMPGASTDCPGINMNTVRNRIKGTSNTSSSSNSSSSSSSSSSSNKIEWVGTSDKGKRIEAIVPSVNFYDTQRWTNPTGQFKKGEGWIVDNLYRVNGSLQYRVQNSSGDLYYITARKDLVRIVGNTSSSSSSKKYPLPTGTYYRSKHGSRNLNAVKQIQRALNVANFKVGKVDGYYGAKTEDAVRRFQSVYLPYEIDGVYGANTRRELDKQVN